MAKENTIDYGTVSKETDSGIRSFEFKNTGDAPLIISNVKSTCGCTVPSKPDAPIEPGKTGKIDVKYNMNPGTIRKTITVESNAVNVEDGIVALKIKGEVVVKKRKSAREEKINFGEKLRLPLNIWRTALLGGFFMDTLRYGNGCAFGFLDFFDFVEKLQSLPYKSEARL
ncbi:DUF1573 domain-containing protein [Flavobacterium sp. 3HN19-14]|uniref:DUF1573 domain-containing protein n=1 Tax=Flavobacterium sp. 3HN19-14 TaxID=3448133 RepID=UPI003EE0016D